MTIEVRKNKKVGELKLARLTQDRESLDMWYGIDWGEGWRMFDLRSVGVSENEAIAIASSKDPFSRLAAVVNDVGLPAVQDASMTLF